MTLPDPAVATQPVDFTAPWIEAALRMGGLPDARVGRVLGVTPIGTGQMASCYRIELEANAVVPPTLIAKVAATGVSDVAANAYRSELRFYEHVAPLIRARLPRCHYAAMHESGNPFVLLLEDVAPAVQGDQIAGCDERVALSVVLALADVHGPMWEHRALEVFGQSNAGDAPDMLTAYLAWGTEEFIGRYGERLTVDDIGVLREFCLRLHGFRNNRPGPRSLLHGDYRLDNLLFVPDTDPPECIVVDWQTAGVGSPGHDLAYVISTSLAPPLRREHERALVDAYRVRLATHGPQVDSSIMWDNYRFGLGHGVIITVLGAVTATRTERGDDMFMAMASRICSAIGDLETLAMYES